MKNKKILLSSLVLYLLSTAASYAAFTQIKPAAPVAETADVPAAEEGGLAIDPGAPKTEECPLNGAMFTTVERQAWEQRRPLAIMVENSVEARPHSGLIKADVIYEAVAEGGVTRFMPVYYCAAQAKSVTVAPVRSARTYFIDWASEYGGNPLYGHVGGANCSAEGNGPCKTNIKAQAIEQLAKYGWRYATGNDLDQFSVGAKAYIRNENRLGQRVATEHSVEGYTEKLWGVGKDRGFTNKDPKGVDWTDNFVAWKFKDDASAGSRGQVAAISHDFWEGYKQFDARWEYDREANQYKRFTGGEPHTDLETKTQITAKNVVVLLTKEHGSVDELKHNLYDTIGEGRALVFQDGQVIDGFWEKKSRTDRTIFTTKKGDEIQFNRGVIWISVVDKSTNVAY